MTIKPTILFIPGLWEGPTVFTPVISLLTTLHYPTLALSLPSTGSHSPGNPSMHDDTVAIRSVVQKLVEEEEKDVVMVCHSAGAFLGSGATEGLSRKEREKEGKKGGVGAFVFLAGGLGPVGFVHEDTPFMDLETGKATGHMYCKAPRTILFNDLSPSEADKWVSVLQPQPSTGWNKTIEYTGWTEIPSVYLICENDQILPVPLQEQMATMAGSRIERCGSGHMVMLSMPERVLEVINGAVEDI